MITESISASSCIGQDALEVILMESKTKIRRMYQVQGDSINEIVRKTGISRNTIRKIIRSEKAEYKLEVTH